MIIPTYFGLPIQGYFFDSLRHPPVGVDFGSNLLHLHAGVNIFHYSLTFFQEELMDQVILKSNNLLPTF